MEPMEESNCRTCLAAIDIGKCIEITKKCYLEKTLKEVIIYLVPEMEPTLFDGDLICRSCVRTLKLVMKFIEGCLEVETIRGEKNYLEEAEDNQYITEEGPDIKDEQDSEYYEEDAEVEYQDYTEDDENTVMTPGSTKKVTSDHDYMNKQNIECEYECEDSEISLTSLENKIDDENGGNLVEYKHIPDENARQDESNGNHNRPIEIVYHDILGVHKVQVQAGNQEGNIILEDQNPKNEVYIEYENDESLMDDETKVLTCSTCSEVFTSEEGYQMHMEIHPPFKCQYCDKALMSDVAYKSHMLWHKEKGFMCEFCGRCFKSSGSLNMHINCTHEDETIYTCEQCPKQYKHKFKLDSHMRSVHLKIGRVQCQECGKYFQNKEACESHYRLIHLQIKPFVCDICGIEFGRKDYLQKHMHRHTTEVKRPTTNRVISKDRAMSRIRLKNPGQPVVCKVCGKQIKTVHLLRAHLQTHVRIKRHKCKFCELTFTLSTNRDRHEKLHESDPDNKYRCNICWKRVKTEEDLERHVAGHRNRPPQHSCDICGEKFHRRYLVDNHLLDKHTGPGDIEKAEEEIVFKNLLEYVDPKLLE